MDLEQVILRLPPHLVPRFSQFARGEAEINVSVEPTGESAPSFAVPLPHRPAHSPSIFATGPSLVLLQIIMRSSLCMWVPSPTPQSW